MLDRFPIVGDICAWGEGGCGGTYTITKIIPCPHHCQLFCPGIMDLEYTQRNDDTTHTVRYCIAEIYITNETTSIPIESVRASTSHSDRLSHLVTIVGHIGPVYNRKPKKINFTFKGINK